MSRIKLLKDVVDNIHELADSLETLVAAMESDEEVKTEKTEKPVKKEKAKEPEIKLEDVRKVLSEKSGAGFTAEVKELLIKHGGKKLSEIKPEEYAALLIEVEGIG